MEYIQQFLGDESSATFAYSLAIASFNSAQWDGKFDSIVSHFETELGYLPDFILKPDFDLVLYKIRIIWDINIYSSNEICDLAIENLKSMTVIDDDNLENWMETSCNEPMSLSQPNFETDIYGFQSDDDLSFELIQIRTWLRFIGCPMSLIYRLSRRFYFTWTLAGSLSDDYQYEIRKFVFSSLRGFVAERDFFDLESALFGPSFGFIVQRMVAFRIFKNRNVPRDMCAA